jgi:protocatechuate 3,4-dioxygenase beta subunit
MKIGVAACWLCLAAGSLSAFQATGSIEGQVLNLATGAPLKRASVRLSAIGRRAPAGPGNPLAGPQQAMRETDDQGRFSFANLDAGRYYLSAERQGFLRQNYGGRKYNNSGTPIVLAAEQRMNGLVLKMSPQSVIAGKVLDEDGEPVASLQVRAFKMGYRGGKKQWVQAGNGQTSDIGEYRIPALEPGRYLVATNQSNRLLNMTQTPGNAPLPDKPDMRYAATYYPSTVDENTAAPVDVTPGGEIRGIDIRLVRTAVYRVRGRVAVAEAGGRGPMVMLMSKDGTRTLPGMGPARPPDFRFEIAGVPPGSYTVVAQAGGRGQESSLAFQPIEVQNRHVDGVVLSPAPGADVTGTVKVEDASGPVDVSRLNVTLQSNATQFGPPPRGKVADGAFVLRGVAPLRYQVRVSGLPEGCYVKSISYGGREAPADGVEIVAGGTIDIAISAAAGDVTAAVVDKDGKPVAGATVALISNGGSATQGNTTDENGAVSFRGLKPGDYTVIAWEDIPSGAYLDPEFVKNYSGTPVKVEPRGKAAVQVKAVAGE